MNIAGVEVGEIKSVRLEDGRAIVGMKIEPRYSRVYRDASVLLRPKTGLKDMVAELTPGTPSAGRLREGGRIPVSQTLPDVNLDEILAALDTDTRDYLKLLLSRRRRRAQGQRRGAGGHDPALRADGSLRAPRQRGAGRAARQHQAGDPQLLAADGRARQQGRPARRLRGQLQRRVRHARGPGGEPARDAARAAVLVAGDADRAGEGRAAGERARPDAPGPAAGRAGARADAARPAAVPARDHADHPRRAAAVRSRGAANRARVAPGAARPRRRDAGPDAHASRSSTACSTCSPTTRRATRTRATCSGCRGPTTSAPPCSLRRTPTARSAAAWSCSAARRRRCSTRWRTPTRSSARSSTCSAAPTASGDVPVVLAGAGGRRLMVKSAPSFGRIAAMVDLRAVVLRPAAVPVAGLRRLGAAQAAGLPLHRLLRRGDPARQGGRRPDLRRAGRQGQD